MKIAIITANLGGIDVPHAHVQQNTEHQLTFINHDDSTIHPRTGSLYPRMQAKIPRMFGWEMHPGFDVYVWLDAAFKLVRDDSVEWLLSHLGDNCIAMFPHPDRSSIADEGAFITSRSHNNDYLFRRYGNEPISEQVKHYLSEGYVDDELYAAGIIVYRPTDSVKAMMRDWLFECCRWTCQDQLSLPLCLKKHGIVPAILPGNIVNNEYFRHCGHTAKIDTRKQIDVVMLANSDTNEKRAMTQAAIDSLHKSSVRHMFRVLVMETYRPETALPRSKPAGYPKQTFRSFLPSSGILRVKGKEYRIPDVEPGGVKIDVYENVLWITRGTVFIAELNRHTGDSLEAPLKVEYNNAEVHYPPLPFNYNAFMNYGIKLCRSEWVAMVNNDVIFHRGWADKLIEAGTHSASPKCPRWSLHGLFEDGKVYPGYRSSYEIAGWCILVKKEVMEAIGYLDERVYYMGQDLIYGLSLYKNGFTHALVTDAKVTHLLSKSHDTASPWVRQSITDSRKIIEDEWKKEYNDVWQSTIDRTRK